MRRLWRRWLAIAAAFLLLILAGCGQASSPSANATASATAEPTQAALPATWQAAPAPGSALAPFSYMPAPSDARVTYACGYTPSRPNPNARIWRTTDRGATWSSAVTLPFTEAITSCAITVDAEVPQRVVVALNTALMGASPTAADFVAFLSQDGGATWRLLPQAGPHGFMSLASYNGSLYAAGSGLNATGAEIRDVWVSRDSGVSWQALGATELAENPHIWVNPQTGELLGTNDYDLIPTLWRSEDGGASWTRISVPNVVGAGGQQQFVVSPNGSGWRVCVAGQTAPGPQGKTGLACSDDLGATWTTPSHNTPGEVFAITDDGALLVVSYTATGVQMAALKSGASVWKPLGIGGALPGYVGHLPVSCVYTNGPGSGMLWVSTDDSSRPFATTTYP